MLKVKNFAVKGEFQKKNGWLALKLTRLSFTLSLKRVANAHNFQLSHFPLTMYL